MPVPYYVNKNINTRTWQQLTPRFASQFENMYSYSADIVWENSGVCDNCHAKKISIVESYDTYVNNSIKQSSYCFRNGYF